MPGKFLWLDWFVCLFCLSTWFLSEEIRKKFQCKLFFAILSLVDHVICTKIGKLGKSFCLGSLSLLSSYSSKSFVQYMYGGCGIIMSNLYSYSEIFQYSCKYIVSVICRQLYFQWQTTPALSYPLTSLWHRLLQWQYPTHHTQQSQKDDNRLNSYCTTLL